MLSPKFGSVLTGGSEKEYFLKKFTKSAILTNLKSCDRNELCDSCCQWGEERRCKISAGSAQLFGREVEKGHGQTDGRTVHDDNTLSGMYSRVAKNFNDVLF